eukprot:g2919.t1
MRVCARLWLALVVVSASLGDVQFHVDVVEPLPGQVVPYGRPVKLVADIAADRAFDASAVRLCLEVDLRPHSCFALTHPGRPRIHDLPVGRHSIAASLQRANGTAGGGGAAGGLVLARPLPVTFFVERPERLALPKLGDLHRMAIACGTDKGLAEHAFTLAYAQYFEPLRERDLRVLEIGVRGGSSLQLWHAYFPRATIVGLDVSMKDTDVSALGGRVVALECDQSDPAALQRVVDRVGGEFDIVIDDGGHTMQQQQVSLGFLFPHLKPGGLYVIEDLHTSKASFYERELYNPTAATSTLALLYDLINHDRVPSGTFLDAAQAKYVERHTDFVDVRFRKGAHGERAPRRQAGSLLAVIGKLPS